MIYPDGSMNTAKAWWILLPGAITFIGSCTMKFFAMPAMQRVVKSKSRSSGAEDRFIHTVKSGMDGFERHIQLA
jgi:hypothetical protein